MRATLRSSRACQMYSGGPSSPAWATVSRPCFRASSNTALKSSGGCPTSEESSPTATIHFQNGSELCKVSIAASALRCRRKHIINSEEMPNCCSPSSRARRMPVITVSNGTPLSVCAWGSKNISA